LLDASRRATVLVVISSHSSDKLSPGLRRLRSSPRAEAIRRAVLADQARARRAAAGREQTMTDDTQATTEAGTAEAAATETPAPSKKTAPRWHRPSVHAVGSPAMHAGPKKAAPKKKAAAVTKAKKAAPKAGNGAIAPLDAIIRVETKENPRRPGTVQHERYEKLKRFGGKTVQAYLAAGGHRTALNYAVAGGHVRLG
jgi:hypothetical protein